MAFDVSTLATYTNQNKLPLITKALISPKSASLFTLQTGVKGPTAVNLLSTTLTAQARGCGWTALGDAVLSQRVITPAKVDFMASFCPSTLEAKWTTHELIAGAKNEQEVLPFEQVIAEDYVKTIAAIIEKAAWQGDTGSGDANLNKGDGLIKIIDAAANEILANATTYGLAAPIAVATGITKTNVSSIVDAMVLAIPSTIASRDDIKIVCGTDVFRLYVAAIKDANLYHFAVINDGSMELTIPGTNYKLIGVDGLNGTSRLFAFSSANVMYGVDLLNDAEDFEIYHAKEAREMRFTASCNYGFQVAYPDEVVSFKLV